MTPEQQIAELQMQLGTALASLDWQTERANGAVNRFKELQKRVDGALDWLNYHKENSSTARQAIKILTGEGENA